MSVALELEGTTKYVDTAGSGAVIGPSLASSLTVTESAWQTITVASASETSLAFGGVSAGKALIVRTTVATTIKLNGEATGHAFNPLFVWLDSAGGITSAAVTQSSGGAVSIQYMVAG